LFYLVQEDMRDQMVNKILKNRMSVIKLGAIVTADALKRSLVMEQKVRRHIGQILLDGKFLSSHDLDRALDEQKHTKELLGQVLVRMGVLKERDVKVPLLVQDHLCHIDDAVKIAVGERKLLGALLVQSGHITNQQLDHAIAEQKRSGEKLGEVFTRLGLLTERQLTALLDFQQNQGTSTPAACPLRLGELLIATGYISRTQLDDALQKQTVSHKRLGDVLVEEGYVRPGRVKYGIRLQKMLLNSVLAAILSLGVTNSSSAFTVNLQWDPNTEADLAGYKVYYNADSASLVGSIPIDVHNQTAASISGLDPDKAYQFAVTAYNTSGQESSFSNVVAVAEQSPPTVSISSPSGNVNVSGIVSVAVSAADNVGVSKVEYYVDNILKATDMSTPYLFSWDTTALPPGNHALMAKAYDAAGNVAQSATHIVTVVHDLILPSVAIISPSNNATVNETVTISAAASDDVGVSMVEFYCDEVLLFASNAAPYRFNWNTVAFPNGSHALIAKAYDNAGNVRQSSVATVTVNNPDDVLTVADASLALQVAVGRVVPTSAQKTRLDVAPLIGGQSVPDGKVNTGDAIVILTKIVGKAQ
jgi:chitinase